MGTSILFRLRCDMSGRGARYSSRPAGGHGRGRGRGRRGRGGHGGLAGALGLSYRDSGQSRPKAAALPQAGKKRRRVESSAPVPSSLHSVSESADDDSGADEPDGAFSDIEDDLVARPARPQPDQTIDADEKAAKQLERKLGLGKGKSAVMAAGDDEQLRRKRVAKLNKEFADDGYGDDFGEFLEGLGDVGNDEMPAEKSDDEGASDQEASDERGSSDEGESDEESAAGAEGRTDLEAARGPTATAVLTVPKGRTQAYVPPHRKGPPQRDLYGKEAPSVVLPGSRGGASASAREHVDSDARRPASEARIRIRRRMQGLVNRLSESNIEPVARELEGVYKAEPQGDCNAVLLGLILDSCAANSTVLRPLVMVFGALLASLHVRALASVGPAPARATARCVCPCVRC